MRFYLSLILFIFSVHQAHALDCNNPNLSSVDATICTTIQQSGTTTAPAYNVSQKGDKDLTKPSTNLENNDAGFFRTLCIPCEVITKVILITNDLGQKVYDSVRAGILALLGVGLALWILFNVAKLLFPFTPLGSAAQINNMVANRVFITILVGTFLLSFANFWNYLYTPVIGTGMAYTNAVMTQSAEIAGLQNQILNNNDECRNAFAQGLGAADGSAERLATHMNCLINNMTGTIGIGLDIAFALVDKSNFNLSQIGQFLANIVPALLIAWTYGKILIFFPFRIVDIVLRWGVFVILSPLIVAAFAFPATRSFTLKGLQGIVEGTFELLMIAVLIALAAASITAVAANNNGGNGDLNLFYEAIKQSKIDFDLLTPTFWGIYLTGWITDVMIGKARVLAKAFSDPDGKAPNFDIDVGTQAAKDAASAGTGALKTLQSAAGSVGQGFKG